MMGSKLHTMTSLLPGIMYSTGAVHPEPHDDIPYHACTRALVPAPPPPPLHLHACMCRHSAVQHVALDEYKRNLARMVAAARAAGARHVLVLTPPPVHDQGRKAWQEMVRRGRRGRREAGRPGLAGAHERACMHACECARTLTHARIWQIPCMDDGWG